MRQVISHFYSFFHFASKRSNSITINGGAVNFAHKACVSISFDKDKLDAISYFLATKDLDLQAELERVLSVSACGRWKLLQNAIDCSLTTLPGEPL